MCRRYSFYFKIIFHFGIMICYFKSNLLNCNIIDGTKLPPICIFKGKRMPHNEQVPPGVVVWFQKNGWMDSSLMLKYVDYFNDIRSKNGTRRNPAMLVYDSFKGHL